MKRETESGSSPDRSSKKSKTKKEFSPPGLLKEAEVEDNKAELQKLIEKYSQVVDPLVRFTFNTVNTTAAERQDVYKAAHLFMRRGPNVAPGALPVGFGGVAGLAGVGDPGNEPSEIRLSGAQQVANWIADAQARGYAAGVGVVRFTIELTSDNGGHWSAPFEVLH